MYIKIKRIKQTLLILSCLFFVSLNYFTYAKADDTKNVIRSCNNSLDADCDGLIDKEEKLYGTDANKTDTDSDGYSDGVEVKSGYDPTIPAPGDKIVTTSNGKTIQKIETSLTDSFTTDLEAFMASKEGQSITSDDVDTFVTENMTSRMGEPITLESLPEFDDSQLKILDQSYLNLSSEDKKNKMFLDASEYFTTVIYLLISNSPKTIETRGDLTAFNTDFMNRVVTLASTNPDYAYFSDLGNRLEIVNTQLAEITVPETLKPLHIKFIRIIKGFLLLRDESIASNDPLSQITVLSKAQPLVNMATNFIKIDLANYLRQL